MSQLEQPNKNNNPYTSPEEMARELGLTLEEAASVWNMWNYKKPTDPQETLEHANKASRYEHGMRAASTLICTPVISHKRSTGWKSRNCARKFTAPRNFLQPKCYNPHMIVTETPAFSEDVGDVLAAQTREREREYQQKLANLTELLKSGAITSEHYLAKERELHAKRTRNL